MHQATVRGFDICEAVLHGLTLVTGSQRLNCYVRSVDDGEKMRYTMDKGDEP